MNKIFCIGSIAAGKTFFAKEYSIKNNLQYIDFDRTYDMSKIDQPKYISDYFNSLPDNFIIDNIPMSSDPVIRYYNFFQYANNNNVSVYMIFCSNPVAYLNRVYTSHRIFGLIDIKRITDEETMVEEFKYGNFRVFNDYSRSNLDIIRSFEEFIDEKIEYKVYDSFNRTFISIDEKYRRLEWLNTVNFDYKTFLSKENK